MANAILPLFSLDTVVSPEKKILTPTQAAYVAGLLDGEGYIGMHVKAVTSRGYRYKTFEYFIVLTMTDRAFMEGIAQMIPWGGGTVGKNARTLHGRAKPAYRMKWSSAACVHLCRAILPYVRLKKPHVEPPIMRELPDLRLWHEAMQEAWRVSYTPTCRRRRSPQKLLNHPIRTLLMSLVDCSDGPIPLEDPPLVTDVERLYASVLCMVDELQRARVPHFFDGPTQLDAPALVEISAAMLVDLSSALLAWIEAQEAARG